MKRKAPLPVAWIAQGLAVALALVVGVEMGSGSPLWAPLFAVGGAAFTLAAARFLEGQGLLSRRPASADWHRRLSPADWALMVLVAPIAEEILFRGALQPALGFVPATALFALVHGAVGPDMRDRLVRVVLALPVGLALGLAYLAGGLFCACFTHILLSGSFAAVSRRVPWGR